VILSKKWKGFAAMALLLGFAVIACHKEEQAVEVVAKDAANAQRQAQAAATEIDKQRAALAQIPLPTRSLYVDVHEANAWANPFLTVNADTITLRVMMADANPSTVGAGSLLRPAAARRQQLEIRVSSLADALVALPPGAWQYGRVVAIAEAPLASRKVRPQIRRNVEFALRKLNDLGVVVEEWPSR
jgi:hypothetical protein